MSALAESLAAQGGIPLVSARGEMTTAAAILERAGVLDQLVQSQGGRRILSLDSSPATLLALLVVAERRQLQLILGRASMNLEALGETLRPDLVVHSLERIERRETGNDGGDADGGIFLLTSGTTGTPKVVQQTLPALLGRVQRNSLDKNRGARWLLTYETHSFAGLQVVLSAAMSGGLLVVPAERNPAALVGEARAHGVTHISGTPTFWRALLLSMTEEGLPSLRQITLGGEAVDQATLNRLSAAFPEARVSHIYASTEAGALFAVHDGRAGFPAAWLEQELPGGVRLRLNDGVLEVRSPRRMQAYATGQALPLSEDGWLVTGDLIQVDGDRAIFNGRLDQIVNIAGLKVSPQEVESFLLDQAVVAEASVYAVPSPLAGSLLAAKVVIRPGSDPTAALEELRGACARGLPRHKIPRRFEVVDSIPMANSGKKAQGI